MKKTLLHYIYVLIAIALFLSSCSLDQKPLKLRQFSKDCKGSLVVDHQLTFFSPNVGPLSLGYNGFGVVVQADLPGIEIEEYIGPPPPFSGFSCLTLIVKDQGREIDKIDIYLEDGYGLRLRIKSESVTEYLFSSGRLAVSPPYSKQQYIVYDYIEGTVTIDVNNRPTEYIAIQAEKISTNDNLWLCSNNLERNAKGFVPLYDLYLAWLHDFVNKIRELFLALGAVIGTLWFWVIFIVLICISLYFGWVGFRQYGWIFLIVFWVFIPILTTIVFMRVLFYDPNCPLIS